jgi:hypothetical protein
LQWNSLAAATRSALAGWYSVERSWDHCSRSRATSTTLLLLIWLFPLAILLVGTPVVLLVRVLIEIATRL